jgi:hypothetical protein
MDASLRRAIAFVAATISGAKSTTIYSHTEGSHTHITGNIGGLYDHDAGAHISGSPPNMYHHGLGNHFSVNVSGTSFNGYDHGSGQHFQGTISGRLVTLYDYGIGRHLTLRPETQVALRIAIEAAMEGEVAERQQELKALVVRLQRIDTLNEPEPGKRLRMQEERRQGFGD